MTSINFKSHWFDLTGSETFDLLHARLKLCGFGHRARYIDEVCSTLLNVVDMQLHSAVKCLVKMDVALLRPEPQGSRMGGGGLSYK